MSAAWSGRRRPPFGLFLALYAAGVLFWLVLGLVPLLAEHVGPVRSWLTGIAAGAGGPARAAQRAVQPMADMSEPGWGSVWQQYAFSAINVGLGVAVFLRRPGLPVPRLLAVAFLGTAATFNLPSHAVFHLLGSPWPISVVHFGFHLTAGVAYGWAVVLFPDGALPLRWRRRRTVALGVVASVAAVAICWWGSFLAHPQFFLVFFGVGVPVLAVAAAVARLTDPRTPAQSVRVARLLGGAVLPAAMVALAWLLSRLAVLAGGRLGQAGATAGTALTGAFPAAFALVPVVLTVGVVRFRLWDVDRLLSRLLAYTVVVAGVGAAMVVAVGGVALVTPHRSGWASVLVPAVVATGVEPVRRRAQRWANLVIFGQRLSPREATRALARGLQEVDGRGDLQQLVAVTVAATRARRARLWLRSSDMLVCVADSDGPAAGAVPLPPRTGVAPVWSAAVGDTAAWPVTFAREVVAVLAVSAPDDLRRADRRLLAELAGHAGALVNNATLTVDLAREIAALAQEAHALRIRRRQVVAAQDAERRRLERDLHDGAQQSLVAALIGLRTAARVPAPERSAVLGDVVEILVDAEAEILELCDGAVPAAVAAGGLGPAVLALADRARRSGTPVDVVVDEAAGTRTSAAAVAVYFSCAEALANAAKHAAARQLTVRIGMEQDRITFEVGDDGAGFDPARLEHGPGGLGPLLDRVRALGGQLAVLSAVGAGTTVAGAVPDPERQVTAV